MYSKDSKRKHEVAVGLVNIKNEGIKLYDLSNGSVKPAEVNFYTDGKC